MRETGAAPGNTGSALLLTLSRPQRASRRNHGLARLPALVASWTARLHLRRAVLTHLAPSAAGLIFDKDEVCVKLSPGGAPGLPLGMAQAE